MYLLISEITSLEGGKHTKDTKNKQGLLRFCLTQTEHTDGFPKVINDTFWSSYITGERANRDSIDSFA